MFNTNEHILHLYECIDELRDELHVIRMRQNVDAINSAPLSGPYATDRIQRNISGLNWSVELENERSGLDDIYLGVPPRRTNSTRSANSTRSPATRSSATRSPATRSPATRSPATRNRATTGLTPPSNPIVTTPNSVEFTLYEPRISSVRERLDNLLTSLRRDYNLPPPATGAGPNTTSIGVTSDLGDDESRRLTLAEINTGCETKIHSGPEETCSICREPINDTSIIREIKNCRHNFHQLCLDTWLENRRTCPICRGEVCLSANTAAERASAAEYNSVVEDLD